MTCLCGHADRIHLAEPVGRTVCLAQDDPLLMRRRCRCVRFTDVAICPGCDRRVAETEIVGCFGQRRCVRCIEDARVRRSA